MRGDQGVPRLRISGATTEQSPYQQGARKRETDETEYILHHNPPCAYTRFEPDYARHDAVISACRANDGYTRPPREPAPLADGHRTRVQRVPLAGPLNARSSLDSSAGYKEDS
jgi:hypothetical protein